MTASIYPLVSIVTTTLNAELYIPDLLCSLALQTFKNFEHIVVDAGSTDNTLDIITFKSPTTRVYLLPGSSMYEAINHGFSLASGDIYCYINADDTYLPETLSRIVDAFMRHNVDFVTGQTYITNSALSPIALYRPVLINKSVLNIVRRILFAQPSTFWTKRAFYQLNGFDTQYLYASDTDFFVRSILLSLKYSYVPLPLSNFRQHNASLSSTRVNQMFSEFHTIMNSSLGYSNHSPLSKLLHHLLSTLLKMPNLYAALRFKLYKFFR